MLFSIIIPCFNCENTIEKCLKSVFDQTFSDWEIILVDDESTDNSKSLILNTISNYTEKTHYFYKKNKGPGIARNYGIQQAKGEYLCFLDSDDYLDTSFLENISKKILINNPDVIFYDTVRENRDGHILSYSKPSVFKDKKREDLLFLQASGTIEFGLNKVIKRSIVETNQIRFSDLKVGEEVIFTADVMKHSNTFAFMTESLYHYVHSENGQHKKGLIDPWRPVIEIVKDYYYGDDYFTDSFRKKVVSNLAMKSFAINVNRICLELNYKKAKQTYKASKKEYTLKFCAFKSSPTFLEKKVKIVRLLLKLHLFSLVYLVVSHKKETPSGK